ncbi:MAG: CDP-diacylglycerol--glycerol-3-phosphate 3-phosphatidyltransferase [Solirubrobacteraceae bacterium MAG38_C4-C5]|nr:CDP-diacylglycerol--glycerol-3-phosphate 3-phosphatidyltransferase [Candidatus Siliceabacter maunaloa]
MLAPNLPNALTVGRILLVPVLVAALLAGVPGGDVLAAVVFAVASLTDYVDGWLARQRDEVTAFGKLMDPIADKLLVVAALVSLVSLERLAAWVAMVIIARELAVTLARAQSDVVIPAGALGKAKTTVQVVAIFCVIAFEAALWVDLLVYGAVAITVVSGLEFFFGMRRREAAQRAQAGAGAGAASSHSRAEV